MRQVILKAGKLSKVPLKNGGIYVAVGGPRLETAAEIRAFRMLGGDVVGMTGMPEASLARELEICYSGISVVANYAAGMTKKKLTTKEVINAIKASTEKIKQLLKQTFKLLPKQRKCFCREALTDSKI
jgi:5'-methylthioadenosine phosphorylase